MKMLRAEAIARENIAGETVARPAVIRTGRGLTIAGTRITLYQILDYLKAGWSPNQIQYLHRLTDPQMAGTLAYIQCHGAEVEREYELVLRRADDIRAYWEDRNGAQPAGTAELPARPDREALRARLQAWKKRLSQQP
jgi:uncharacterized protein (DUF433 family)